jgi:uncharacterized caspase-like protein
VQLVRGLPTSVAALLLCLCCLAAVATPAGRAAHKAALVIGNAHYSNVGALKNPANDAQDVCTALKSIGFEVRCVVDVATRVQLRAVVEDFVESLPDNAVSVVYYAGHAVQVNGENYLIPTNAHLANEEALPAESVSLAFLMGQLRRTAGYLTIVVLDACRNNPLVGSGHLLAPGLAQITDIPDSTEVLYATAANESAMDGLGRNGTLTKHLLAHLREPGSVDDLFKQVSLGVQSESVASGHTQKPALYTNFTGEYCFVRCTDLEMAQQQRRDAEQRLTALEARVNAGDQQALAELAAAKAELRKKDEEQRKAEKAAKERQNNSLVPPAF